MFYEFASIGVRKENRKLGARLLLLACLCASAGLAQEFQLGAASGYGFYRQDSVFAPGGTASAGITNRFVASAVFDDDLYQHFTGELRYLYQDGDPFLKAGATTRTVNGQSHAIDYSVLFQFRDTEHRIRPYLAAGIGAKGYIASGPAPFPQSPQIATLTSRDQWMTLFTPGAGIEYRMGNYLILRVDFRDYITRFPKDVFVPAAHGTDRGIFNQFTPMLGLSYVFNTRR